MHDEGVAIRGGDAPGECVAVRMLGPFTMTFGEATAGPWPRPPANRGPAHPPKGYVSCCWDPPGRGPRYGP